MPNYYLIIIQLFWVTSLIQDINYSETLILFLRKEMSRSKSSR